jgi:hypothetical protein
MAKGTETISMKLNIWVDGRLVVVHGTLWSNLLRMREIIMENSLNGITQSIVG